MFQQSSTVIKVPEASTSAILDAEAILGLDLEGFKLIEASAGTGKTHTIADLYLRHILSGRQPSQILIVTYTNAATEELRGRVRRRLYETLDLLHNSSTCEDDLLMLLLKQSQDLDEDSRTAQINRLQLAIRSMDEASISTIHSFCQRSLQQHALSGNQLFDSAMLTDDDSIWESAIKDWWRNRTYELDSDGWQLIHDSLPDLDGLIATLLELRNKPSARIIPETRVSLDKLMEQPRKIANSLHRLAPLWLKYRSDIVEVISNSPVLSRAAKLPYHPQNLPLLLESADNFFSTTEPGSLFQNFQYLGADLLQQNSKPSKRGQDPGLEHEFFKQISPVANAWLEFTSEFSPQLRADAFHFASLQVIEAKRELTALAYQDQLTLLLDALESSTGEALAESLRQQYPVAMIDEFQDTDSIQYRIFSHIYLTAEKTSLTLIGDPKQAIYSFRGGDIFTYMQARQLPQVDLFSLQTNWRSQPNLVHAINTLFSHRPDAFIYRDSILFSRVESIAQNTVHELRLGDQGASAMTLWQLPANENQDNYSRQAMRDLINQAIATEISGLLEAAGQQSAAIDGRPVQSGDIAILVRQASEGQALSRVLNRCGIRTVTIGRDSVYQCDEARGLYDLLLAISQYQDQVLARRSLSSSLLDLDYRQIAAIVDCDSAWQGWLEDLGDLHQLWVRQGFIAMFQSLLHKFEITRSLAQKDNRGRRITNLLHLAELLQQQSMITAGMSPMISWFQDQFEETSSEDAELRLEDDEALVKIVTIHKSKGLQYPIVFVPFLWSCKQVDRSRSVYFHDSELAPCIDLGSPELDANWLIAEKERLAEDMRLLYVALTRARTKVYLAWGLAGDPGKPGYANQTALAYLLHSRQTPPDLESAAPDGFPGDMNFASDLQNLVDKSAETIELLPLPLGSGLSGPRLDVSQHPPAQLAKFSRTKLNQWRINSFTGLTRGIHQPGNTGTLMSQGDSILDFPAGSHIGLLIHSLLENLDFQQDTGQQCRHLFPRFLPRSGLAVEHEQTLLTWLENVKLTPLDNAGMTLSGLANEQRLNELSFDFALDHLDIAALNQFMQSLSPVPLKAVNSPEFRGLMTGVIDLVFVYQGRYYIADYKSNFLGTSLEDYGPEKLQLAMLDRRYDLQSLLYSLALHRFLQQRLNDYNFEQHFGGAYYLFLRAMRPQHGNRYGVHFDRPAEPTIQALDQLMSFTPLGPVNA
jgi:exodeoxyribonuclease V beta subunit